jgi:hypothetical protein
MANMNEALDETAETRKGTFTKKKPGALVIDQFGNLEKKRRLIGMDISDICMPPLTRKKVAKYRGVDAEQINLATGLAAEPVTFLIPGTYMFYDRGEQDPAARQKLMCNYGRPEIVIDPVSKKQVMDDKVIDYIEFFQGVKYVDVEKEFALYVFMELHPFNKSNKFRPNTGRVVYERVDLQTNKEMAFKMAEADLGVEAEREVINTKDPNVIIARAISANIPVMEAGGQRAITEIKLDLRNFARTQPKKFFGNGGDYKMAFKMNILDAQAWGLLDIDEQKRTFIVPVTDEKVFRWEYGIHEDPIDAFVEHCLSDKDGKELYDAIKTMVEYWAQ